jgi:hypothetical protein
MDVFENKAEAMSNDSDFELEITDLPPNDKIDHLLLKLRMKRTQLISQTRSRLLFKQSSRASQHETADDDFELEITDLPEEERPALSGIAGPVATLASRFSPRIRHKRTLSVAMVAIAVMLLVLVVLGGIPSTWDRALGLFLHPTPTPAITSNSLVTEQQPAITGSDRIIGSSNAGIFIWGSSTDGTPQLVPVQDPLGPAPQECPQNTTLSSDVPPASSAVGGTPLWVSGFDESGSTFGAATVLTHLKRAKQPELGWYQQITLLLTSNYPSVVVLQGTDIHNTTPLLFDSIPYDHSLTAFLTLDSADPSLSNHTIDDQSWIVMTTNVYVPAAGCYSLSAQWTGGSWIVYFAAGK